MASAATVDASSVARAAAGRVLHGTCGWSDPSIVACGRFYPKSVRTAAEKLTVYSRTFACVEVCTNTKRGLAGLLPPSSSSPFVPALWRLAAQSACLWRLVHRCPELTARSASSYDAGLENGWRTSIAVVMCCRPLSLV